MSFQMRDTVFGNNIVNIHARSGDRCAIIQICNDSGNGSLCRGRRERKNRASSFGERGTANEVHLTANTFTAFVSGQLIEACILGGLTALGMLFIQADYAPLIGVIIGASAIIPVAGAYIGAIVSALLLVMVSPIKALVFLVFLVVLQQIEGNVIYPKVVGTSIGLPGIWVLAAVTIGGGVGGLVGVLLSVPVASVLYALLRRDVHKRLACKE